MNRRAAYLSSVALVLMAVAVAIVIYRVNVLGKNRDGKVLTGMEGTQTLDNAHSLGLAMYMYADDYDDLYPYALDSQTAEVVTYPYTKSKQVWISKNPNGGRLLFNTDMGGVNYQKLPNPDKAVIIYDSRAWGDGSRKVALANGQGKIVTAEQWKDLDAYRKSERLTHVGKPLKHQQF